MHIGLGGAEFRGVKPGPLLPDPEVSAALGQHFRRLLLAWPVHFFDRVEVRDHPLLRLQWVSMCRTAGLLLMRSGSPDPNVFVLLLNGLEDADEFDTVRRHTPMFENHWE